MKTNIIIKCSILVLLVIGIYILIKIENNLHELNGKVSKFQFYTRNELKEIYQSRSRDSLLGAQSIIKITGDVDAHIENTVDVNVNN